MSNILNTLTSWQAQTIYGFGALAATAGNLIFSAKSSSQAINSGTNCVITTYKQVNCDTLMANSGGLTTASMFSGVVIIVLEAGLLASLVYKKQVADAAAESRPKETPVPFWKRLVSSPLRATLTGVTAVSYVGANILFGFANSSSFNYGKLCKSTCTERSNYCPAPDCSSVNGIWTFEQVSGYLSLLALAGLSTAFVATRVWKSKQALSDEEQVSLLSNQPGPRADPLPTDSDRTPLLLAAAEGSGDA
jgi:hypothetical protein